MKLKDIIWEELEGRICIDEETLRFVVRAKIENMKLENKVFRVLEDYLGDKIEEIVNTIVDDIVAQTIDSEIK